MINTDKKPRIIKRGDVFWVRLDPAEGVETKKTRPVVVVSNDEQNAKFKVIIVVPVSTKIKKIYPTFQVPIYLKGELRKVRCEQVRTVGKHRIKGKKIATLTKVEIEKINQIL